MAKTKGELRELYRSRAARYNLTANLYYLLGYREYAYRRRAVSLLNLRNGETVVDLCCGTGLNFEYLRQKIGSSGKIIGVDLTPEMIEQARLRVRRHGWENVELIESDVAEFDFPRHVDGAISTYAISLVPECDRVIQHAFDSLKIGTRMVIIDNDEPAWAPRWLKSMNIYLQSPFGTTSDLFGRKPWESLRRHGREFGREDVFLGFSYIAYGEK